MGRAYQRAGDDSCLAHQLGVDSYLYLGGTALQPVHLLVEVLASLLAVLAQFADGLADGPQLRIVGMALEASLVGKTEHLVVDSCRVADAQHVDASVHEFL